MSAPTQILMYMYMNMCLEVWTY